MDVGTEIQGGDIVVQLPGMLQHEADLQISVSEAQRDYNKSTVQLAGERNRTQATAVTNLVVAKGAWEQGLASQWSNDGTLDRPTLDDGSGTSSGISVRLARPPLSYQLCSPAVPWEQLRSCHRRTGMTMERMAI